MTNQVYVGNFPVSFTIDDILNLFQDFEGIELLRTRNNNKKCFAFMQCVDENQVIDVITTMHDIDVCSRNLVVRATDKELQNLIEESLREDKLPNLHPKIRNREINSYHCPRFISKKTYSPDNIDDLPYGVRFRNPHLDKGMEGDLFDKKSYGRQLHACHNQSPTCEKESILSLQSLSIHDTESSESNVASQNLLKASPKRGGKVKNFPNAEVNLPMNPKFEDRPPGRINSYQRNSDAGPTQSACAKESIVSLQNLSIHDTNLSESNVRSQNLSKATPKYDGKVKKFPNAEVNLPMNAKFEDRPPRRINSNQQNSAIAMPDRTIGFSIRNSANERVVQRYKVIENFNADLEPSEEPMYYVSVANFPFNTTIAHLYELFQDIEPHDIVMVCNYPNKERRVTEAILCFKSEDQAIDTIMDHDNTLYNGRYLVVSDACDKPMFPSLPHLSVK